MSLFSQALETMGRFREQSLLLRAAVFVSIAVPPVFVYLWTTGDIYRAGLQVELLQITDPVNVYSGSGENPRSLVPTDAVLTQFYQDFSRYYFRRDEYAGNEPAYDQLTLYAAFLNPSESKPVFIHTLTARTEFESALPFEWRKLDVHTRLELKPAEYGDDWSAIEVRNSGLGPALDVEASIGYGLEGSPAQSASFDEIFANSEVVSWEGASQYEALYSADFVNKYLEVGPSAAVPPDDLHDCERTRREMEAGFGKLTSNGKRFEYIHTLSRLSEIAEVATLKDYRFSIRYRDLKGVDYAEQQTVPLQEPLYLLNRSAALKQGFNLTSEPQCDFRHADSGEPLEPEVGGLAEPIIVEGSGSVLDAAREALDHSLGLKADNSDAVSLVRQKFQFDLVTVEAGQFQSLLLQPVVKLAGRGRLILESELRQMRNGWYRIQFSANDRPLQELRIQAVVPDDTWWSGMSDAWRFRVEGEPAP